MKKQIVILVGLVMLTGLFISTSVQAQYWSPNGTHIYNNNSGWVGIGTGATTPQGILDIQNASGEADVWISSPYSGSSFHTIASFILKNSATGDMAFNGMRVWSTGNTEYLMSSYRASDALWMEYLYFNYNTRKYELRSGVANVEFLNQGNILFNNTGKVGINMGAVAIPSGVQFAVNGKINCKEVEVTLTGWSDHVFKSGYTLKSLSEVETYINENKHLPDVPSEAEVLQKGNNLGQMDAILLQKIEELTLYVIQLKKENDQLKDKVNHLR